MSADRGAAREAQLAHGLAAALLAGPWELRPAALRLRDAVGSTRTPKWATALAGEALGVHRRAPIGRQRQLARELQILPAWRRPRLRAARVVAWPNPLTQDPPRPAYLPDLAVVPETVGELADWLGLGIDELAWFADLRDWLTDASPRLEHYRVTVVPKQQGVRVLEAPKPRLKSVQRRVLRGFVGLVPPHRDAHGGVPGRGVRTATAPHAGHRVVIRVDLESFFAGITAGRVYGVLHGAGLPEEVAHTVTGLVTTTLPGRVWRGLPRPSPGELAARERLGRALRRPHLPQGAPTSPALANLVAFALDRRLDGLVASWGGTYTRYVDDLIVSGDDLPVRVVLRAMTEIVGDCGWRVAEAKTIVRRGGRRQQVLGAVINAHPAIPRHERDRLRAVLHNCRTQGPASQCGGEPEDVFRARLAGRIAWVGSINPGHGQVLRTAFERIDWSG